MPLPRRRWFQFRLTTWFGLVAILAWAMLYRPWVDVEAGRATTRLFMFGRVNPNGGRLHVSMQFDDGNQAWWAHIFIDQLVTLIVPAIILVAFVVWKAFLAIRRRVAGRNLVKE